VNLNKRLTEIGFCERHHVLSFDKFENRPNYSHHWTKMLGPTCVYDSRVVNKVCLMPMRVNDRLKVA